MRSAAAPGALPAPHRRSGSIVRPSPNESTRQAIGRVGTRRSNRRLGPARVHRGTARPISQCLREVDTPAGRRRVQQFLAEGPWPRYAASPDAPGLLVATDEAGARGGSLRERTIPGGALEGSGQGEGALIQVPDQRPILIAIAGPNGAGKTTFFHSHLSSAPDCVSPTAATSCPSARSALTLAAGKFSSARNRTQPVFRTEGWSTSSARLSAANANTASSASRESPG